MQYAINHNETDMYRNFLNKHVIVHMKDGNYVIGILRWYVVPEYLILESTGCTAVMNGEPIEIVSNFHFQIDEFNVASITSINITTEKVKLREKKGNLPPLIDKNPPYSFKSNQGYKKIYGEDPEPIESSELASDDSEASDDSKNILEK